METRRLLTLYIKVYAGLEAMAFEVMAFRATMLASSRDDQKRSTDSGLGLSTTLAGQAHQAPPSEIQGR